MTKADIGELGCRILSIFTFTNALAALQFPLAILQQGMRDRGGTVLRLASFAPAAMLLLFSALLWFFARRIAANSVSEPEDTGGSPGITPQLLQSIGFSIVGILILVDTLGYLGSLVSDSLGRNPVTNLFFWIHLVITVARLAIGAWLILGSDRLRILGTRMRDSLDGAIHKDW